MVPILDPTRRWQCPSCERQHVTHDPRVVTPMHPCTAQKGLMVPYVEVHGIELAKHSARHVVVERGDYVGGEQGLRTDAEGRVAMGVSTERADGSNDFTVFAPTATAQAQ